MIAWPLPLAGHAWAQADAEQVLHEPVTQTEADYTEESLLPANDLWVGDLDGMRERKRIRILVPFSKTFYFIERGGGPAGITYEMGKAFDLWLNKRENAKQSPISVVFIPVPRDRLLSGLADGTGDIAAGNLTITEQRSQRVDFSHSLVAGVREIVVTGPGAPRLLTFDDLGGREIFVRASSSYYEHLETINQWRVIEGRRPVILRKLDEDLEDEDIMEMVNAGLLPWGVVDESKASLWSSLYTNMVLRRDLIVHEGGEVAWAIRRGSPLLKKVVDEFADGHKIGAAVGNFVMQRYFGSQSPAKRATSEEELGKLEGLIDVFRTYGRLYRFDALMIAAQGYQESKLDQTARSRRGAVGIMQLMPSTAADPAIAIKRVAEDADANIHAGAKYLRLLVDKFLDDPALDDKNRMLMAFAAYNAGPGKLQKFRKLAKKSGLNPNVWFGNVEHAAAKIVGRETVQYVANIYIYYVAYYLTNERIERRRKLKIAIPWPPP